MLGLFSFNRETQRFIRQILSSRHLFTIHRRERLRSVFLSVLKGAASTSTQPAGAVTQTKVAAASPLPVLTRAETSLSFMFDVLHLYFTSLLEVMEVISHDAAVDLCSNTVGPPAAGHSGRQRAVPESDQNRRLRRPVELVTQRPLMWSCDRSDSAISW